MCKTAMSAQARYEVRTGQALEKGGVCQQQTDGGAHGSLTKEEISYVIRRRLRNVRACYQATVRVIHRPQGTVSTQFLIAPNGRVASACIVESELKDSEIETCLAYEILTWRFPEPREGGCVVVSYPFDFTAD
jgi:hypothetical protein